MERRFIIYQIDKNQSRKRRWCPLKKRLYGRIESNRIIFFFSKKTNNLIGKRNISSINNGDFIRQETPLLNASSIINEKNHRKNEGYSIRIFGSICFVLVTFSIFLNYYDVLEFLSPF